MGIKKVIASMSMAAITNSKAEQNEQLKRDLNRAFYKAYEVHVEGTLGIQTGVVLSQERSERAAERREILKRDADIAAKTIEFYRKEQEK